MQKNLEQENKLLKMELDESKNNYKKLSLKIGKLIFQNEEYEREIKNLKYSFYLPTYTPLSLGEPLHLSSFSSCIM